MIEFEAFKVTGVHSLCCGEGVKTRKTIPKGDDRLYVCLKCKEPCDHYFVAEIKEAL
jgi:hypothetical protein